jgi:hypothetical protein
MKKRILLLIIISAMLNIISCKKDVDPDIDNLSNQNFRILKVEQIKLFETPPFANSGGSKFSVIYDYAGDSIITACLYKSGDSVNYRRISIFKEGVDSYSMTGLDFTSFYCEIGSYLCGINKTFFDYNKTGIQSLSFETRYTFGFGIGGQIRKVEYDYIDDKINNIKTIITLPYFPYQLPGNTAGESSSFVWSGNILEKYKSDDFIGYVGFWGAIEIDTFTIKDLVDEGKFYNVQLNYTEVPQNFPKELISKVNQLLSGIIRGPLEDYVYNWQVDFLYPGNNFLKKHVDGDYKEYVQRLQSSDKSILADWMWSFAHPSFNVLPEQDKLIASKRINGRKIVDIIDDQPVYQNIDSTATFPYVFDPVAKTLEIAGLKIWYEVLD